MSNLIQRSILPLIIVFLPCVTNAIVGIDGMSDNEIAQLMTGSWAKSPQDPDYSEYGAISTYKEDGSVEFTSYMTKKCNTVYFKTKALWKIKNGHLLIQVVSSERPDYHPIGLVVVDRVVSINTKNKILESESGTLQYRIKSETCAKNNDI